MRTMYATLQTKYLPDPKVNIEENSPMWWAWQGWLAAIERMGNK